MFAVARRGRTQQQDIEVTIAVEIGHDGRCRNGSRTTHADLVTDVLERAIAIVVEQLSRLVPVDQQQVQIGVVVQVQPEAVDGRCIGPTRPGLFRDVFPLARFRLAPQLVGPTSTEVHIQQAVVVEVAPQRCHHSGDLRQGMVGGSSESTGSLAGPQQHVVAIGGHHEQVLVTVGIDVAGGRTHTGRHLDRTGSRNLGRWIEQRTVRRFHRAGVAR